MIGAVKTLSYILRHPLNRSYRLAAVLRWLRWQIASRLAPGPIIVGFGPNTSLAVSRGMTGATGNIYTGLHEFEDMAFLLHFLRPGDMFVDVGANVGSFTILAAGETDCDVVAFEPTPGTFKHLQRNIRLNGLEGKVRAHNMCVGSQKGDVKFVSSLGCENHVSVPGDQKDVVSVPMDKIDSLLKIEGPALLKIDVEGYETEVIRGAAAFLQVPAVVGVIMELNDACRKFGFSERTLHEQMLSYGFKPYAYDPFSRKLSPLEYLNTSANNTLYLKSDSMIQDRLTGAKRVEINGMSF